MAADTSPVCAPEMPVWQSCPPTISAESLAAQAIWATSVAGGQSSISQPGAGWALRSAVTSHSEAAMPFIFQLPAASLRIAFPPARLCRVQP
jgi:hypothetical protein